MSCTRIRHYCADYGRYLRVDSSRLFNRGERD